MLSANPQQSSIFRLVNEKATALLEDQPVNVVDRYLPPTVELGARGASRPVYQYLLGLTRHTPRDLLQLLENVRKSAAEMSMDPDGRVPQAVLREGVLRYANCYFVDAINDELVGRGTDNAEARSAVTTLRDMRKRTFTVNEYTIELFGPGPSREDQARAEERLRWLFFAGAIGNVVPGATTRYLQFFHRRDDSDIYLKGTLVLHNALVYAWAIPWA